MYYLNSKLIQKGGDRELRNLDKNRPVCPQICELLCVDIVNGVYDAERRLPAVRELAAGWGVNPNTVQKALDTLEEQGLLHSVRGSGWYVREDISRAREVLQELRIEKIREFFAVMESLGLSPEETCEFVKEWYHE